MAGWILRKPAFQDTPLLLEHLLDAPEAGKCGGAEDRCDNIVIHEYGRGDKGQPRKQKQPPAPLAPIIFHLDHYRMAHSDDKERGRPDDYSAEVHVPKNFRGQMYENYLDSRRYSLVHPVPFPAFDPGHNRSRGNEALMEAKDRGEL